MDSYVDNFQAVGGSMVMLAKGEFGTVRSRLVLTMDTLFQVTGASRSQTRARNMEAFTLVLQVAAAAMLLRCCCFAVAAAWLLSGLCYCVVPIGC